LIQPRDVIFKLTESNPGLFDTGADFVGKMELLPVLWVHFTDLFLWEGSPEPDCIGVGRRLLHRRLETPPTIWWNGGRFLWNCHFSAESGQEIEKSLQGFSESGMIIHARVLCRG